jgi:hypothetical protein
VALRRVTILSIAGLALGQAAVVPAIAGDPPQVKVSTTGSNSELLKTIPIERHDGDETRVVMSMGPHKLPALNAGDRLKATAELQVTSDCRAQRPRCAGRPYTYAPTVDSRLILARGDGITEGHDAVPISSMKRIRCPHSHANFVHHCLVVFGNPSLDVGAHTLGCLPDNCHLNFAIEAHSQAAKHGDVLVIGGSRPDGEIAQDKGRINAIRFHPGSQHKPHPVGTSHRLRKRVGLDEHPEVVLSKRLRGLRRNEQLDVKGLMRADVSGLPYEARVNTQLIVASRRSATATSARLAKRVSSRGAIDEANGSNCTHARTPCPYSKVGVLRIRRDAVKGSGDPVPLFVNLVVKANPKFASPGSGDRLRVLRGSKVELTRYPASRLG